MTIGILECGAPPAALQPRFGSYGAMMGRMLGPHRSTQTFAVSEGTLPPDVAACEAYVLTGSAAGVYDDLPWIAGLLDFLRRARGRAKLVGICFGHQAMAEAFGGAVVKSPKGWSVGLHRYEVVRKAPWMDEPGMDASRLDRATHVDVAASHQDQVVICPPDARVTLASAFTPLAGLDYGDAVSFQFHPEFTSAYATALIEARADGYGGLAAPAIASHRRPNDGAVVGRWIDRFLGA